MNSADTYKIIRAFDIDELAEKVNEALLLGYKAIGGMVIESHAKMGKIYYQSLVTI
jgi:hypothetical protein